MQWTLSEEQELMLETARDMVTKKSPVGRVRELRDNETGFSMDLWKEMAQLGWVGVSFPEELGGAGLGFMDLCLIVEQAGRELMPEPFLSTVLLGAQILLEDGNDIHVAYEKQWYWKASISDSKRPAEGPKKKEYAVKVNMVPRVKRRERLDLSDRKPVADDLDDGEIVEDKKGVVGEDPIASRQAEVAYKSGYVPGGDGGFVHKDWATEEQVANRVDNFKELSSM